MIRREPEAGMNPLAHRIRYTPSELRVSSAFDISM